MNRKNQKMTTYFVILSLFVIGIVYALLQANLQINGIAKIQSNTWDIHFDNIVINPSSVAIDTEDSAATIDPNDTSKVDFSVTLGVPGDFYEFTVDVVNSGTIDGMIGELNKTLKVNNEVVSEVPDYLNYSVTYDDGGPIIPNHLLSVGETLTYLVRLEFRTDIEELPEAVTITTSLEPQYIQADSGAIKKKPYYACTYDGELVHNASYENGQYIYHYISNRDAWIVQLKDKDSTDPVTTRLCTTINDKVIYSMTSMFSDSQTTSIDTSSFDTSNVTSMSAMFKNCTNLEEIDVSNFDTSSVTEMTDMFYNCTGLTDIDVSHFNTSNVLYIYRMFYGCSGLTEIDVSNFNTSNVTNMFSMFYNCTGLTSLDLSNFRTDSLASYYSIENFVLGCTKLKQLDISNWDFSFYANSGPISYMGSGLKNTLKSINLSNVILPSSCSYFFKDFVALEEIILDNIDTSHVTTMEQMFYNTSSSSSIEKAEIDITVFKNLDSVTSIYSLFREYGKGARSVIIHADNLDFKNTTSINSVFQDVGLSSQSVKIYASNWNLENVTSSNYIFASVGKNSNNITINASNWNLVRTTTIENMFWYVGYNAYSTTLNISGWTISNQTSFRQSFQSIAYNSYSLKMVANNWNVGIPNTVDYLFDQVGYKVVSFDVELKNWKFQNATKLDNIFRNTCCDTSITTTSFSLDLTGWEFPNVTKMSNISYYAFRNVNNMTITGLNSWDTSHVTDMSFMFYSSFSNSKTVNLDLSNWDVSNVTNFSYMFVYCASVNNLSFGDFSSWNIKEGANLNSMFSNITIQNHSALDIGSINIPSGVNTSSMFSYTNIKGIVNMRGNPSSYSSMFSYASTYDGGEVIVNYTSSVTDIDAIIATKTSNNSNVVKGSLITT